MRDNVDARKQREAPTAGETRTTDPRLQQLADKGMYNPETGVVFKRLESNVETIKKTGHTTHRRRIVYKQFNALHVAKMNHEYQFVYHCVAV